MLETAQLRAVRRRRVGRQTERTARAQATVGELRGARVEERRVEGGLGGDEAAHLGHVLAALGGGELLLALEQAAEHLPGVRARARVRARVRVRVRGWGENEGEGWGEGAGEGEGAGAGAGSREREARRAFSSLASSATASLAAHFLDQASRTSPSSMLWPLYAISAPSRLETWVRARVTVRFRVRVRVRVGLGLGLG